MVVAVAGLTGCGGGGDPPAPDRRAEEEQWIHSVDTACAQTEQRVAARGRPASFAALPGFLAGTADDVHEGVRDVEAVRTPAHMRERVAGFHRAVKRVDPMLAALEHAARAQDADAIEDAARLLEGDLEVLRTSAEGLGLQRCARARPTKAAFEALDALFFFRRLTLLDRRMQGKLADIASTTPDTFAEAANAYRRLAVVAGEWIRGWDRLLPPANARHAYDRYRRVLVDTRRLCRVVAGQLEREDTAAAATVEDRFTRLQRPERAALAAVRRAVKQAAEPVTPDPPGDETPDGPETT